MASDSRREPRIHWHVDRETAFPFGRVSPDPARWEPIGFPPPWPDRPWVFGVMVCSANGIVAWARRGPDDDPVRAILGGEDRPERIADRRHMRYLRAIGDAAVGAQTVRDQPTLLLTPEEPGDEPVPALYRFRVEHRLGYHPRHVVYSLLGRLPRAHPMFNTPGLAAIVVTTPRGAAELARRRFGPHAAGATVARGDSDREAGDASGAGELGREAALADDESGPAARRVPPVTVLVDPALPDADGLRRVHRRLFAEHGVRYLACEGGETVLGALREARLLDEVFLTVTDVVVDERAHDGVLRILDFATEGAEIWAEGRIAPGSGYTFRRWRFSRL